MGSTNNNYGITIGQTADNALLDNNVVNNFFYLPDPNTATAITVRGSATLYRNVLSNSALGIDNTNTATMTIGSATDPSQSNTFYGNSAWNIKANVGPIDKIPAKGNTWYGLVPHGSLKPDASIIVGATTPYDPLDLEGDIQTTIYVVNPNGKPQYSSNNKSLEVKALKGVDVVPFNLWDPLGRFEHSYLVPNSTNVDSDNWRDYR